MGQNVALWSLRGGTAPYTGCPHLGGSVTRVRDDFFEFIAPLVAHLHVCVCLCNVWSASSHPHAVCIPFRTKPRMLLAFFGYLDAAWSALVSSLSSPSIHLVNHGHPINVPRCGYTYVISHYALRGRRQCIASHTRYIYLCKLSLILRGNEISRGGVWC